MLVRFKEIWYGAFFGIGAVLIDAEMHSSMANRSLSQELGVIGEGMLFYRILFLGFGLFAGWLMWRSNRREREFRAVQNRFHHFQSQHRQVRPVSKPAAVLAFYLYFSFATYMGGGAKPRGALQSQRPARPARKCTNPARAGFFIFASVAEFLDVTVTPSQVSEARAG